MERTPNVFLQILQVAPWDTTLAHTCADTIHHPHPHTDHTYYAHAKRFSMSNFLENFMEISEFRFL